MANPELNNPFAQANLGVKTGGRKTMADLLSYNALFGPRKGGGGREGRSKRQIKNEMAEREHLFHLQDEIERARTARWVEGSAQVDANAYDAADKFFGGGMIPGVADAHSPRTIVNMDARPQEGSFRGTAGTSASWKYANGAPRGGKPGRPDGGEDEGPLEGDIFDGPMPNGPSPDDIQEGEVVEPPMQLPPGQQPLQLPATAGPGGELVLYDEPRPQPGGPGGAQPGQQFPNVAELARDIDPVGMIENLFKRNKKQQGQEEQGEQEMPAQLEQGTQPAGQPARRQPVRRTRAQRKAKPVVGQAPTQANPNPKVLRVEGNPKGKQDMRAVGTKAAKAQKIKNLAENAGTPEEADAANAALDRVNNA